MITRGFSCTPEEWVAPRSHPLRWPAIKRVSRRTRSNVCAVSDAIRQAFHRTTLGVALPYDGALDAQVCAVLVRVVRAWSLDPAPRRPSGADDRRPRAAQGAGAGAGAPREEPWPPSQTRALRGRCALPRAATKRGRRGTTRVQGIFFSAYISNLEASVVYPHSRVGFTNLDVNVRANHHHAGKNYVKSHVWVRVPRSRAPLHPPPHAPSSSGAEEGRICPPSFVRLGVVCRMVIGV